MKIIYVSYPFIKRTGSSQADSGDVFTLFPALSYRMLSRRPVLYGLVLLVALFVGNTAHGGTAPGYATPNSFTQPTGTVLDVVKSVDKSRAKIGDTLSYAVVLTNTGTVTSTEIQVSDVLTTGLRYLPASVSVPAGTTYAAGSPSSTWTVPALTASQSLTLSYRAIADSIGVLYNVATIPGDTAIVCTSIPVKVCTGDQYVFEVSAPAGRSSYRWYRTADGVTTELTSQTANTLSITTYGEYKLAVDNVAGKCPDFSCCPFIVEEYTLPAYSANAVAASCTGATAQSNGQLVVTQADPAYTYQYSAGTDFNPAASLSGAPKTIPANGILTNSLPNPASPTTYTIRVFNAGGCYIDKTVTLQPTACVCPPQACVVITTQRVAQVPAPNQLFYGLTNTNQLLSLNTNNTQTSSAAVSLSGLQAGETLLAIDFRPATGQLYGVSSTSRLYVINTTTGAVRAIGTGPLSPALSGTAVSMDFNPTVDRIRLVTTTGQNLRVNPETGTVANMDGVINSSSGSPAISAVAYTNNRAGAATTVLYDIDPVTDQLYIQNPPNNGTLTPVGPLGFDVTSAGGFDISPNGTIAIASVVINAQLELDRIDLNTGQLRKLGNLPVGIIGIAIPTEPVAYAVDQSNNLLIFNPLSPAPVSKTIAGLQAGESVLGLDMRPVNGQLYALGSTSQLYTINAASGVATAVGPGSFTTTLTGTNFGFDFNPTVDRIRVVSDAGQNLRLNPNDNTVASTDGPLNGGPGSFSVTAAAYTNNFAGATTTTLFDIDTNSDQLLVQTSPNNGTLNVVGSLGVNADAVNGFDIGGTSGTAYALLTVGGVTNLYTVNLTTGAATLSAAFPVSVRGFTLGLGF